MALRALLAPLAASLFAVAFNGPASANIVTFKDIPFETLNNTWVEDGITAVANGDLGYFVGPYADTQHLDDSGSGYPNAISFTMAGLFQPISFDLLPVGHFFDCAEPNCDPAYTNVSVQGYLDSALVTNLLLWMGEATRTISLAGVFPLVDKLDIKALRPELFGRTDCLSEYPCTHFNIDNVTLAPVPLPAELPLLASALGWLVLLSWRRKRRAGLAARKTSPARQGPLVRIGGLSIGLSGLLG